MCSTVRSHGPGNATGRSLDTASERARVHLPSQAITPPMREDRHACTSCPGRRRGARSCPTCQSRRSTEGTVLVRVKAAGLNGFDNAVAAGMMAEMSARVPAGARPGRRRCRRGRRAPGVDHVAVGDEVIGHVLMAPPIQAGTLAEYALVPAAGSPPSRPGWTSSPPRPCRWRGPPRSRPSRPSTRSPDRSCSSTARLGASAPTPSSCSPPAARPSWPPVPPRTPSD